MNPVSKISSLLSHGYDSLDKQTTSLWSRSSSPLRKLSSSLAIMATLPVAGCSGGDLSNVKVTNGKLTLDYPAVVQILQGGSSCTATFIRSDVLMTAAHCIDRDGAPVVVPSLKIASSVFVVHPDYPANFDKDVALVFFDRDVATVTMQLKYDLPEKGDPVTLVGFGNNRYIQGLKSAGATGVKRTGTNNVVEINNRGISLLGTPAAFPAGELTPTGKDSAGAPGDSGGPLLNAAGEILGIASYVSRDVGDTVIGTTYAALINLRDFLDQNFIRQGRKSDFVETCETNFTKGVMQQLLSNYAPDLSCMTLFSQLATNPNLTLVSLASEGEPLDFALLRDIKWLETLSIVNFTDVDLNSIVELKNLTNFSFVNSGIKDYSPLAKSWSLRTVSIGETVPADVSPLKSIPNISTLSVNGRKIPDINPLRNELFHGSRITECEKLVDEELDAFDVETLEYDAELSHLKLSRFLYMDKDCKGPVVAKMHSVLEVLLLTPHKLSETYKLDLQDLAKQKLTIFDDLGFSENLRKILNEICPYTLGVETKSCQIGSILEAFTLVKKSGEDLWFGESDSNDPSLGTSPSTRHKELSKRAFRPLAP